MAVVLEPGVGRKGRDVETPLEFHIRYSLYDSYIVVKL